MKIVDFDARIHSASVRDCAIALQDHEHNLDPRLPSGLDIIDEYLPKMFQRCKQSNGKVMIADDDGQVAGYVTVLTRVSSDELQDGDFEYGLVADLIVHQAYRRQGIGQRLLHAAEDYAKSKNVSCMRIGVLTGNVAAEELYAANGYRTLFVELEKKLDKTE